MRNADGRRRDTPGWHVSSFSNGQGCVEVRFSGDVVLVRDSKYLRSPANDPAEQPLIAVPTVCWKLFLDKAAGRRTDRVRTCLPAIERHAGGGATLRASDGTALVYNSVEWAAFTNGVVAGEFRRN